MEDEGGRRDGEQFRRRGWRTKEGDGTENGFGNEDGGR